jgi:predicted nuclease of predicted toxin-antitoxin system
VISFLIDYNFNEHIVDGMTRRDPILEFTHVRDIGLAAAPDPLVLEIAAVNNLILLTHDRKTLPSFA